MIKVAPSILAADMLNMERDVQRMIDAGCDLLHVDIMDAHFVPNLSYSPALVKALNARFDLPLDVHLMMDNPEEYIDVFCDAGADYLCIHAEIDGDIPGMLRRIREKGVKAALALKPGTPAASIRELLPLCDMVLVMSVEPGFGGQKFQPVALDKLEELRAMGYRGETEIDGGVGMAHMPDLAARGLDIAVMGTAMYRSDDPARDMARIHSL